MAKDHEQRAHNKKKANGPWTSEKMLNLTLSKGMVDENYPEIHFSPLRLANILTMRCVGSTVGSEHLHALLVRAQNGSTQG